jgi:hypothetical protein
MNRVAVRLIYAENGSDTRCIYMYMLIYGKSFKFMKRIGGDASQYGNHTIGKVSEEKDIIPVHKMLGGFKTRS